MTSLRPDSGFAAGVMERDGRRCVFTDIEQDFCQAMHLVRHSKGDDYMERLSRQRGGGEIIESIDDVRNGLYMNGLIHLGTASGHVAIIRTPVAGIIKNSELHVGVNDNDPMYTLHHFKNFTNTTSVPPNCGVYIRREADFDLPSPFLFDALYGVHCLLTWGSSAEELHEKIGQWSSNDGAGAPVKRGGPDPEDDVRKREKVEKVDRDQDARNEHAERQGGTTDGVENIDDDDDILSHDSDGRLILPTHAQLDRMDHRELAELFILYGCRQPDPAQYQSQKREKKERAKEVVENWRRDVV